MSKRPAFLKNDRIVLASHVRTPVRRAGCPDILRDTVLTVSHVTGRGTLRAPWIVAVTDGNNFWHIDPSDLETVS